MHRVAVIICTRNRADSLRETLSCIGGCTFSSGLEVELVVVDNASTDHTKVVVAETRLQNLRLRYVREDRAGQCYARNHGIAESDADLILFTDDDVRVPPDWVQRMSQPIQLGEADVVVGGVNLAPQLRRSWMTEAHGPWLAAFSGFDKFDRMRWRRTAIGANMGFARRVLRLVPGFDTELGPGQLGFGDETLFTGQLGEAGCRIEFVEGAAVEHHFDPRRLTRASFVAAARAYGRSSAYMCHHWSHGSLRYPVLQAWKMRAYLAWFRLRRGRPPVEGIDAHEMALRCYFHFCVHYAKERHRPRNYVRHGLVKLQRPAGRERAERATPAAGVASASA